MIALACGSSVSGGGQSVGAVAAHFRYIDRKGELDIETDEGDRISGEGIERELLDDWGLDEQQANSTYSGMPGRKPTKLVHNIVFSMPGGTPPDKLLAAVRHFAQEKFALQHRYAMVLHTDHDHPHVHLVLKAVSEEGVRLNIRKATLREWRRDFAAALRLQGVAANATERAVRGVSRASKRDVIYRAMLRGDSSYLQERASAVARELSAGRADAGAGKQSLLRTRKSVEEGWLRVSDLLHRQGENDLAYQVSEFVHRMPPPNTEREWLANSLRQHLRKPRTPAANMPTR
jgi:type IV secretory pathway VirD2 relaxase